MSLTGSLSDLQISIPFFVPSVSEQGPGLGSGGSQGVCEARAGRESIRGVLGAGAAPGPWGITGSTGSHHPCPEPSVTLRVPTPIPLHQSTAWRGEAGKGGGRRGGNLTLII